ncbi:MAG TPA: HD-GYP domain-containing protein, partial [Planctomycetota bacterium]|nr:HD-GYP domain-containing protein [Planctomycetota bacterium]
ARTAMNLPPYRNFVVRPTSDRLLLVDSQSRSLHLAATYLERRGYIVDIEVDGLAACRRIACSPQEARYDLVTSDMHVQGDGAGFRIAEVCAECRPRIPVILLADAPSLDAALFCMRHRVADFLARPIALDDLERRIRSSIDEFRKRQRMLRFDQVEALLARVLPNVIAAKDPSTRGHSDRVAEFATQLGRRCGLDDEDLGDLRLAARLHDIGKVGVPEAILTKQGPLSRAERVEIEKHPQIGHDILEPLVGLTRVRDWVFQHHEHWDGRGYPCGLRGTEVDLPGRILIVAEVFDALATARCYKEAWSRDKIADFFEASAGRHFDPELATLVAHGVRLEGAAWFRTPRSTEFEAPLTSP